MKHSTRYFNPALLDVMSSASISRTCHECTTVPSDTNMEQQVVTSGHLQRSFFRVQYFKFLDSSMASLKRRYDQPGIQAYIKLESILLKPVTAVADVKTVVEQYPEFDGNALHIQLAMLKQMIGTTEEVTLQVVVSKLVGLDPVVRGLFPQVEQLVRLLLTIPCSSAEAERSFSGLRRLKSYLRNSMGHARLNHLAVLHVHQAMTDGIDLVSVAREFISKCDSRLTTFGQ